MGRVKVNSKARRVVFCFSSRLALKTLMTGLLIHEKLFGYYFVGLFTTN